MEKAVQMVGNLIGVILVAGLVFPCLIKEGGICLFNRKYRMWIITHKSVNGHSSYF